MRGQQNLWHRMFTGFGVDTEAWLIDQYYRTLRAKFECIPIEETQLSAAVKNLVTELDASGEKNWQGEVQESWRKCYELEQRMVAYYDAETLKAEWIRVRSYVKRKFPPERIDPVVQQFDELTADPEALRAVLSRILNDVHWYYISREAFRVQSRCIRRRNGLLFCISVAVFLLSLLLPESGADAYFSLVLTSAAAGLWGACFSILVGMKKKLEEADPENLRVLFRWDNILARPIIGMGAALILFFVMQAGLLTGGSVIPDIGKLSDPDTWDRANFGLLVVWCFLAGFSEQFVPNLISTQESKLTAAPETERAKPPEATEGGEPAGSDAANNKK